MVPDRDEVGSEGSPVLLEEPDTLGLPVVTTSPDEDSTKDGEGVGEVPGGEAGGRVRKRRGGRLIKGG